MLFASADCKKRKSADLADNGQDPRLAVVISVSTHTQVNLVGVGVRLVSCSELEDAVDDVKLVPHNRL